MTSQLRSGCATYGQRYELHAITAVVVGGTSLNGGEGSIGGTMIGGVTIVVIANGMNLFDVESEIQLIVLGSVILGAMLLDRMRNRERSQVRVCLAAAAE